MMKQVRQVAMYQRIARQQQQATEFALQACMQATMNMSMMGASYAMIYSQMLKFRLWMTTAFCHVFINPFLAFIAMLISAFYYCWVYT
jgi:hypothetical protein